MPESQLIVEREGVRVSAVVADRALASPPLALLSKARKILRNAQQVDAFPLAARIRCSRSLRPGEALTIAHHSEDTLTVQEHDLGASVVQRKVSSVQSFRAVLKPHAIRTVVLTAGLAVLKPHLGLLYLWVSNV